MWNFLLSQFRPICASEYYWVHGDGRRVQCADDPHQMMVNHQGGSSVPTNAHLWWLVTATIKAFLNCGRKKTLRSTTADKLLKIRWGSACQFLSRTSQRQGGNWEGVRSSGERERERQREGAQSRQGRGDAWDQEKWWLRNYTQRYTGNTSDFTLLYLRILRNFYSLYY